MIENKCLVPTVPFTLKVIFVLSGQASKFNLSTIIAVLR